MTVDQVPSRAERRTRIAVGMGCAFAGHVVAAGPWLYSVYTFTVSAEPDSAFFVAGLTGVLQLMLFVVCLTLGVSFLRGRQRYLGMGLLTGWFLGGIVVLDGGSALIGYLATVVVGDGGGMVRMGRA